LLLGLMSTASIYAADNYLVLWEKEGAMVGTYDLTYNPKVTFTETEVIVSNDLADVFYYSLPEMWKFTYQVDDGSGINNILADGNTMSFRGDAIVFPALEAGSNIRVYAVNGILVLDKTIANAGEYAFPLSSLSQGVYMVIVNGKTYKIVKK